MGLLMIAMLLTGCSMMFIECAGKLKPGWCFWLDLTPPGMSSLVMVGTDWQGADGLCRRAAEGP